MKYFIANWKANKNVEETRNWVEKYIALVEQRVSLKKAFTDKSVKVIIAPQFPVAAYLSKCIAPTPYYELAVQDISRFKDGKYTGEVTAKVMKDFVSYVIIGHSERRLNFLENNDILFKKVENCLENNLTPIYCIRDANDPLPPEVTLITYEPVYAIGTGINESIDKVLTVKKQLMLANDALFFYGGSYNKTNKKQYIASPEINGFLIGTASLEPEEFVECMLD